MFPPKLPGHRPPQASSPAGATATRPSIGWSGISMRFEREFGRSSMPTFRCLSSCQTQRRAGSGSFIIRVRPSAASPAMPVGLMAEIAVSRFSRRRRIFTTSVSFGVAPSM